MKKECEENEKKRDQRQNLLLLKSKKFEKNNRILDEFKRKPFASLDDK